MLDLPYTSPPLDIAPVAAYERVVERPGGWSHLALTPAVSMFVGGTA